MVGETLYLVCPGCGAWTWDVRVLDFPQTRAQINDGVADWKLRHLPCRGAESGGFGYVAESSREVLDLDPRKYEDCTSVVFGGGERDGSGE